MTSQLQTFVVLCLVSKYHKLSNLDSSSYSSVKTITLIFHLYLTLYLVFVYSCGVDLKKFPAMFWFNQRSMSNLLSYNPNLKWKVAKVFEFIFGLRLRYISISTKMV